MSEFDSHRSPWVVNTGYIHNHEQKVRNLQGNEANNRDEPKPHLAQLLINKHVAVALEYGFEHLHVFLRRVKPYNPKGRWQTEQEAQDIDQKIRKYLTSLQLDFLEFDADREAAPNIINALGLL